ncbi:hypothetical protein TUMEXPCC7403_23195 [Tumidithrix helvetica PCC 7403]|uniref:hypothetical protein n=1 Tax=Tumidithrix helvetica TaxID=3457545 RepID=UPI003C9A2B98
MSKAHQTENLNIELASDLYEALQGKAQLLGKTTTDLIEKGLRLLLEQSLLEESFLEQSFFQQSRSEPPLTLQTQLERTIQTRFSTLEKQLENYVNVLVEQRLKHEGFSQIKLDLASNTAAIATIQTQIQTLNQTPISKQWRSQTTPSSQTGSLQTDTRAFSERESEFGKAEPTSPETLPKSQTQGLESQSSYLAPTIRQLQVGDLVQIRDPDSPHYMEKLRLTKVSLIRASIQTETGEHTYLKRDLRFVQSEDSPES